MGRPFLKSEIRVCNQSPLRGFLEGFYTCGRGSHRIGPLLAAIVPDCVEYDLCRILGSSDSIVRCFNHFTFLSIRRASRSSLQKVGQPPTRIYCEVGIQRGNFPDRRQTNVASGDNVLKITSLPQGDKLPPRSLITLLFGSKGPHLCPLLFSSVVSVLLVLSAMDLATLRSMPKASGNKTTSTTRATSSLSEVEEIRVEATPKRHDGMLVPTELNNGSR
ncbi:hypothetical protein B296_00051788 [Ensete ventricosum]|uniref:Uncharacterized protein n=1 Tax=Ensete ventricosum TaxID=4639 RepID=A0A426YFB5_ENSVE|nr:hypothetical protein B296_00051788 [Ensete ventricosum]